MMDAASGRKAISEVAATLDDIVIDLTAARDSAPPGSSEKTELRRLALSAEKALAILD